MDEPALYVRDGDAYVGTILTQGGWDPDGQNGAAVLALLGHVLEDVPSLVPMTVARFTADLVRPVPIGPRLHVVSSILREGKKIQVVQLQLLVGDVEHVRAIVLRLREADVTGASGLPGSTTDDDPADRLVRPEHTTRMVGGDAPNPPGFLHGIEMRRAPTVEGPGFGYWIRLDRPVVAGEPIRATSHLTVGFDFANLINVDVNPASASMINPDVTAHVLRPPTGDWIAVVGDTRFQFGLGRGVAVATLSDLDGPFAFASTSQLVQLRS